MDLEVLVNAPVVCDGVGDEVWILVANKFQVDRLSEKNILKKERCILCLTNRKDAKK